jgi:predicted secreted protein
VTAERIASLQARKHATIPKSTTDTYSTGIRKWEVRQQQSGNQNPTGCRAALQLRRHGSTFI